jgi:hypothetical protein
MSKRKRNPRAASQPKPSPLGPEPDPVRDEAEAAGAVPPPDSPPSGRRPKADQLFTDAVTLLEIAKPEDGGVREIALPGDRSLSPPSPPEARRGRHHPVVRMATYVLVVAALTFVFVVILIAVFRVG